MDVCTNNLRAGWPAEALRSINPASSYFITQPSSPTQRGCIAYFDVFDLKVIKSNYKRPAGVHMLVLRPRKLVLLYVLNSSTTATSASPFP